MPQNKPIHVVGFKFKRESKTIRGIQVLLSNGINSPIFETFTEGAQLEEIALNSQVKKIRGTENSSYLRRIHFQDKNGKEIAKIY